MILELSVNQQRSTSVKINKKNANGGVFPMAFAFILLTAVLVVFIFKKGMLEYSYSYINNALTQALLSACIINLNEYADNGTIVIQESDAASDADTYVNNSYKLFQECLRQNLELDYGWNSTSKEILKDKVIVEEFRIYNVVMSAEGQQITEYVIGKNGSRCIVHPVGADVSVDVTDGVKIIEETSIYAKISFVLDFIKRVEQNDQRYYLSRLCAVKNK